MLTPSTVDNGEPEPVDRQGLTEAQFQQVMLNVARQLWQFGQEATEATLAALYDVLQEVGGGLEWRVAAPLPPQQPA